MNRKILALAVPNIVTNITIPLLGMVDLALMGHLSSSRYVGAIAIGGMIFNFIFWGFGFLRMGTSGFTAQAYGQRNLPESVSVLARSVFTGMGAGIMLLVMQYPLALFSFRIINGSPEVEVLARQYFFIRIYAAPATLCLYAFTGWFIGMQNARVPMVTAISVNLLNIGFSLAFIRLWKMQSEGIALANVCSQYVGVVMAAFFFRKYYGRLLKHLDLRKALKKSELRHFFHVNSDIFIRTLCLIFTLSFFTTQSANAGDTVLAVNTLLFQFLYFFSYFIDGFAYAAEALAGKFRGAANPGMLRKVVKRLFNWAVILAMIYAVVYLLAGKFILQLMTNNEAVIRAAMPYLPWVIVIPLASFAAFVWDGVYVGVTASAYMRNSMLIATILIFLPAFWLLRPYLGNHSLWLALILFMLTRGISLSLMAKRAVFRV